MQDYRQRLVLPEFSDGKEIRFFTLSGLLIAKGYVRVVIGKRGPYVEFHDDHIIHDNKVIKEGTSWKMGHPLVYYWEYKTVDTSETKMYLQRRTVEYADYIPGMWYISPFLLKSDKYPELIREKPRYQLTLF